MKAYILSEPGSSTNLQLSEISKPEIQPNEVLIRTKAISINPVDTKARQGKAVYQKIKEQAPVILGWDISGIVEEAGSEAGNFKKGDEVFGMMNFPGHARGYAEFVAAPVSQIAHKPSGISFEEAAAATLAALTAYQILAPRITAGQKVLIQSAAGGVGHFAVQIAKILGAEVTAIVSDKNIEFVKSIGADHIFNYRTDDYANLKNFDFSLDTLSGDALMTLLETVKSGGILWTLPSGANIEDVREAAGKRNVELGFSMVESNGTDMEQIAEWLASGQLRAEVSQTFDFTELPKAHETVESGRTRGKVVVKV